MWRHHHWEVFKLQLDRLEGPVSLAFAMTGWTTGTFEALSNLISSMTQLLNYPPSISCETVFFHSDLKLDLSPRLIMLVSLSLSFFDTKKKESLQNFQDLSKIAVEAVQQIENQAQPEPSIITRGLIS